MITFLVILAFPLIQGGQLSVTGMCISTGYGLED